MAPRCWRWALRGLAAAAAAQLAPAMTCYQYCMERKAGPGKIRGLNADATCSGTCAGSCLGGHCTDIASTDRTTWTDYGLDCSNIQSGGAKFCCCDFQENDPLAMLNPMPSTSCSQYCADNGAGNGTLVGKCNSARCSDDCNRGALCRSATAVDFTDFDQTCSSGSKVCCCEAPAGGVYARLRLGNSTQASCGWAGDATASRENDDTEPLFSLWFQSNTDFRGGGCMAIDSSYAPTMRNQFGHEMWFTRSHEPFNGTEAASFNPGSFRMVCNADKSQSFSLYQSTDCTGTATTLGSFSVSQAEAVKLFNGECAQTLEAAGMVTAQFAQLDMSSIITHLSWGTNDLKSPCDAADVVTAFSMESPAHLYVKIINAAPRSQLPKMMLGLIGLLPWILAL